MNVPGAPAGVVAGAGTNAAATTGLVSPGWNAPRGVRAAVTTRDLPGHSPSPHESFNLGSRCGDRPEFVLANRAALVELLQLPGEPVWLRQVHGVEVHTPHAAPPAGLAHTDEPVADAAYTREPGVVCAVLTADCLPLLVASDDGREVAAIHAGWRGLAAGVIEATLRRFDATPARLRVWLGPAIGAASYEVGDEVRDAFVAHDPAATQAFAPTRPGHWLCDLYALARQRLAAFGVVDVTGGGFDTFTDASFYSHRRGRPTGRFASLVWIEPEAAVGAEQPVEATARPADAASPLVFPQLLGAAFAQLPPRVRSLHLAEGRRRYRGGATITRGRGLLSRLCGWATGLPPALTDVPLEVDISAQPDGETWARQFGRYPMTSRMWPRAGLLHERLGLVTFGFALAAENGVLTWRVRSVRALGVPLPAAWFGGVHAREFEQDGRYRFEVAAALPLAGQLVHYAGWLDVD